jgi:hypothetical protein
MMLNDTYRSLSEVADSQQVAEATVRRWIKTADLRAITVGKAWRVASADMELFIAPTETVARARGGATSAPTNEPTNASQVSGQRRCRR